MSVESWHQIDTFGRGNLLLFMFRCMTACLLFAGFSFWSTSETGRVAGISLGICTLTILPVPNIIADIDSLRPLRGLLLTRRGSSAIHLLSRGISPIHSWHWHVICYCDDLVLELCFLHHLAFTYSSLQATRCLWLVRSMVLYPVGAHLAFRVWNKGKNVGGAWPSVRYPTLHARCIWPMADTLRFQEVHFVSEPCSLGALRIGERQWGVEHPGRREGTTRGQGRCGKGECMILFVELCRSVIVSCRSPSTFAYFLMTDHVLHTIYCKRFLQPLWNESGVRSSCGQCRDCSTNMIVWCHDFRTPAGEGPMWFSEVHLKPHYCRAHRGRNVTVQKSEIMFL